jgi:uncharacterized hydrophobic protein (TIGR00271 family)
MRLFKKTRRLFRLSTGLRPGTDVEGTITSITENVRLSGVNIWMLVCSAILASIGLDVNSAAVIIGAMLISPLMSPILGVGLGTAILDRKLLKRALNSFGLATVVGLLTSTLYFFISPLSELTPELTARTTPTLLDVGVAFFGGVAGIVAGSRRDKTNAIPGVAIATALMPPLCTAGFGLANFNAKIFLGAFYLFFINAVFIAVATYLISVLLRFPRHSIVDGSTDSTVKQFVIGFALLTMIPSGLIFYNVIKRLRVENGIKQFVNKECRSDDRHPLQWEIVESPQGQTLKVYIVGREIDDGERIRLQRVLNNYHIGDLQLKPVQLNVSPDEFNRLNTDVESNLTENIRLLQALAEKREENVSELRSHIDSLTSMADPNIRFITDSRSIFPEIADLVWQPSDQDSGQNNAERPKLVIEYVADTPTAEKRRIAKSIADRARLLLGYERLSIIEKKSEDQSVSVKP